MKITLTDSTICTITTIRELDQDTAEIVYKAADVEGTIIQQDCTCRAAIDQEKPLVGQLKSAIESSRA